MEGVERPDRRVSIHAENVGGIDVTDVTVDPDVTVLSGRNASNRTSLLQAIMAALGSERASLKGDTDQGRVELELGDRTYTRTLERRNGEVVFGGDPYTDDIGPADRFAFLLESNEARRAVARGDDLREIIMGPVDTDAIQSEIERLKRRQRELQSELESRNGLTEKAATLQQKRADLAERLEARRSAYEEKQAEIDEADAELEQTRERRADLESRLADLQERRSEIETVRHRLDTETETADSLREELSEVEAELDDLAAVPEERVETLGERIEGLRERKRTLDSKITRVQSLVEFNEEMLDGESLADLGVGRAEAGGSVTSRLLEDDAVVCWTCGQEATREHIEETVDELREGRQALVAERGSVTTDLEDAQQRRDELRERQRRLTDLRRRRDDLEANLADAEAAIETLRERRTRVRAELDEIEADVETLREDEYDEIVELHKEANELELEIDRLESDLTRTEADLASARERIQETETLEAELSDVQNRLDEANTRIERLEEDAIEAFNEHMDAVLHVLDYDNLERIWIERTEREVREGRRKVRRGVFDLHVVRSTEEGAVYEDTVAHLSESEREVTGLVFALAGYLAHDVYETMPFMLLDSVEAIDSERIAALVEYLAEYAPYLVVALLREDAAAIEEDYPEVTDI